jgi:DNA-directed RNA polymerase specialized sigma subunit
MNTVEPIITDAAVPPSPKDDQLDAWKKWQEAPTPQNLSQTLKAIQPAIDYHLSQVPEVDRGIMSGEAKQLAINAIRTYDPSHGTSLNTHVFNHLKPLPRRKEQLLRMAPVGRDLSKDFAQYNSFISSFYDENGREPNDTEIQEKTGLSPQRLIKVRKMFRPEITESQGFTSGAYEDHNRVSLWTEYVYHDLDPQSKTIMDYKLGRSGNPVLTNEQIAAKLGVDPSVVSRRAADISKKILDGARS